MWNIAVEFTKITFAILLIALDVAFLLSPVLSIADSVKKHYTAKRKKKLKKHNELPSRFDELELHPDLETIKRRGARIKQLMDTDQSIAKYKHEKEND